MIGLSTEDEAQQQAITEINTCKGWKPELYELVRESRESETQRNYIIATRNKSKEKNNGSSTKEE